MKRRTIEIYENIFTENEKLARENNEFFVKKGIFVVNILGSPGAGKTSVILELAKLCKRSDIPIFVIEGDVAADIDKKKLDSYGIPAIQINTYDACHLDSTLIKKTFENKTFLEFLDKVNSYPYLLDSIYKCFVFVENIGNLICPADFLIGEHMKVLITSVPEGDDKPYKYPLAFEKASIVVLNKIDLMEHFDFDKKFYKKGIRAINRNVPILQTSCKKGNGFDELLKVILSNINNLFLKE